MWLLQHVVGIKVWNDDKIIRKKTFFRETIWILKIAQAKKKKKKKKNKKKMTSLSEKKNQNSIV